MKKLLLVLLVFALFSCGEEAKKANVKSPGKFYLKVENFSSNPSITIDVYTNLTGRLADRKYMFKGLTATSVFERSFDVDKSKGTITAFVSRPEANEGNFKATYTVSSDGRTFEYTGTSDLMNINYDPNL